MAAAGYAGGLKTSIMFNQTYAVVPQDSEVVQAQLKKIGVEAELKALTTPPMLPTAARATSM